MSRMTVELKFLKMGMMPASSSPIFWPSMLPLEMRSVTGPMGRSPMARLPERPHAERVPQLPEATLVASLQVPARPRPTTSFLI